MCRKGIELAYFVQVGACINSYRLPYSYIPGRCRTRLLSSFHINSSFITHTAINSYPFCTFSLLFNLLLAFELETLASSSSSHRHYQKLNAFDGIEPGSKRWKVSESSRVFDVFINHRGPDVKHSLATQLYNSLEQLGIRTFLDSEEKELGHSFPSIIKTAIHSAKVHIAIFSKRYAESPWCLAELVQMLESKAKIIPVFYEVEPWELRHIERGRYAAAFTKFEEKSRYLDKLGEWKEALQTLSFIAGEEYHSSSDCKKIVAAVEREVQRKRCLHVAKYPVGLNNLVEDFEKRCLDELVQDLVNQCRLEERRHTPNIVGIFGMGGSGKTTLAKELFNRKHSNYWRASFLFDVREASVKSELPSLQSQLLKDLFYEELSFRSIEEGTSYINNRLQSRSFLNFLIVLDDIDHMEQLDALSIMPMLHKSGNSLVIVTTRDVGVVITAGIAVGYPLRGMDRNHGRELFCWHAFGQPHPCTGYETLVDEFVEVCGGLPLSLQVLGRHVHGRDQSYWKSELTKARATLPRDVKKRLRISFESLDDEQKQVFMDTACFFVGKRKSIAERVWAGSGWNARHALETLKDKCLVEEIKPYKKIVLKMHDHLRDLGREMAHELSPPHRLWRPQDLKSLESMGLKTILTKTNVRCFNSIFEESMGSQVTFFLGQSDNFVQTSPSLLWLQIKGISTKPQLPSIPSWIPLQKLQCLKIVYGQFKTLWENGMQVPSQLKELQIFLTFLKEIPDFSGISDNLENVLLDARGSQITGMSSVPMSGLEQLEISDEKCVPKIFISGMHYPSLQSIKLHQMEKLVEVDLKVVKSLNCLEITNCKKLKSVSGISDLANLVELEISECGKLEFESMCLRDMRCLERITFDRNVMVKYFELDCCQKLKTMKFCLDDLVELRIRCCPELKEMPAFKGLSFLERIIIDGCGIQDLLLSDCQNLRSVSGNFQFTGLYIRDCPELEQLSSLTRLSSLRQIMIRSCEKLENIAELPSLARLKNMAAIEKLHVQEYMGLSYCDNALIRNCIHKLKSLPLGGLDMIGRAVDGAESILNVNLSYEANIGMDGIIKIGTDQNYPKWSELSAIIVCFVVVVVDSSISVDDINKSLPNIYGLKARQGEWIITMVTSHDWRYSYYMSVDMEDVLMWKGVMKGGFRVEVKKGEDWKGVRMLRTIVNRLHHS